MGFFSKLFNSKPSIEKQLRLQYEPMLQMAIGVNQSQAKQFFSEMITRAKNEGAKEGTSNLPENYGDLLIAKAETDIDTKKMLEKKRNDGVTDYDIKWWWNLNDIERRVMLQFDELPRLAAFKQERESGLSVEEAATRVRKIFPIFGNPDDLTNTQGEDRPLPVELKERINIFIKRQTEIDSEGFREKIKSFSSFNAFIRDQISSSKL